MNPIRLGCIGTGNICCHGHLPQLARLEEYWIKAMYDVDRGHAERARAIYIEQVRRAGREIDPDEIAVCGSAQELLEQVDAVDICTPLRYHARYAAMALEQDVSAMSEKPMARTWLEANHVAECAARSRGRYQLNDDNLFLPRFSAVKALMDGGWIGDVLSVRIARGSPSSRRAAWFYDPLESGGGAIQDYGSHAVANAWFLIGFDKQPEAVRSLGIRTREKTRVVEGRMREIAIDDDAHFKVLFRNPESGDWIDVCIEATWTHQHFGANSSDVDGYLEVEGTLGRLLTTHDEEGKVCIQVESRTMGSRQIPLEQVDSEDYSFLRQFRSFSASLAGNHQPYLTAQNGQMTAAVLNAAQLSEQRGRSSVTLAELQRVSREYQNDGSTLWEAADSLTRLLNAQYI